MTNEAWEDRYRAKRTGWDRGQISPALQHWLDRDIEAGCSILVPACGYGHEVLALAERGHKVTALDIAPTPLNRLRRSLEQEGLKAAVVEADMLHWQPEEPVDAVYEQTSLCALEPALWDLYADALYRWLRPAGRLYALFMQTGRPGGPPFDCNLPAMRQLFDAHRWRWPTSLPQRVPHPIGHYEFGLILERL